MKYFTKTKFKDALYCPTSLNYVDKEGYNTSMDENTFLKGIAEGGYQVEYLAKAYYPSGIDLSKLSLEDNAAKTEMLLTENENVVLFEPVFIVDTYLVRCDILEKTGNTLKVFEVKAKTFDFESGYGEFLNKRSKGFLKATWLYEIMDVYFQKYVLLKSYAKKYDIETYLMMCDKNKEATVDGLNQNFLVSKDNDVDIKEDVELGESIMGQIQMDEVFEAGYLTMNSYSLDAIELDKELSTLKKRDDKIDFILDNYDAIDDYIALLYDSYLKGTVIKPYIKSKCKTCKYYVKTETETKKSGFLECWSKATSLTKETLSSKPTILDIWNYRKKDMYIHDKTYLIESISFDPEMNHIINESINSIGGDGMSTSDRQNIQITKTINNDKDIFVDDLGLRLEMEKWVYPLNMIDFETTAMAIPFTKGVKPYESIAFQYSHHVIHEDGKVEHKAEYICKEQGKFPSFDFVRSLKETLETNEGSIFMYSPHENSILNLIFRQLNDGIGVDEPDRIDLMKFILSIVHINDNTMGKLSDKDIKDLDLENKSRFGDRALIDLWAAIKKYYYNPLTNGSNSIKEVLPAILNKSDYLRDKYSKPVYGTDAIPSMNFKDKIWIEFDTDANIINPYKQLPALFDDIANMDTLTEDNLANGGDAMLAFAKTQFTQMKEDERNAIFEGLLRYCELDTLAMVMIFEHWKNDLNM